MEACQASENDKSLRIRELEATIRRLQIEHVSEATSAESVSSADEVEKQATELDKLKKEKVYKELR
jgi:hypothetical protein